ncbi:hypothetical protein MTO96_011662 [Rhipicephalus appendiculatus]
MSTARLAGQKLSVPLFPRTPLAVCAPTRLHTHEGWHASTARQKQSGGQRGSVYTDGRRQASGGALAWTPPRDVRKVVLAAAPCVCPVSPPSPSLARPAPLLRETKPLSSSHLDPRRQAPNATENTPRKSRIELSEKQHPCA